jgi:hypothetical protein
METLGSLQELVDLAAARPGLFVRYSEGPDADRDSPSNDYEAGVDLPGWSVTPIDPEPWWTRPVIDWIARRVCKYADLADKDPSRRPWVLSGRVTGRGPDHEPLLADLEPVAWISREALDEALDHYRRAFDVGRDSTGSANGQ